ncbi:MAG: ATP-binding protein [Bacteroidota bacterium]
MKRPSRNPQHKPNAGLRTFAMECISDPKEIGKIESFLQKLNKSAKLDDGTFYRLLVASTEAVNNAIVHGNRSDRRKKVCLECVLTRDEVLVRVQDHGKGFDPSGVPNPLDENNLLKDSGRGIFLIRSMMDRVEYRITREGTTLEMVIDLRQLR